jgi:hypothetical protein
MNTEDLRTIYYFIAKILTAKSKPLSSHFCPEYYSKNKLWRLNMKTIWNIILLILVMVIFSGCLNDSVNNSINTESKKSSELSHKDIYKLDYECRHSELTSLQEEDCLSKLRNDLNNKFVKRSGKIKSVHDDYVEVILSETDFTLDNGQKINNVQMKFGTLHDINKTILLKLNLDQEIFFQGKIKILPQNENILGSYYGQFYNVEIIES